MKLHLLLDMKVNEFTDKKDKVHASFPRTGNATNVSRATIPTTNIIRREARPSDIQHNKFMVLLKGASKVPEEV